jgi:hypothetical protein
MGTLILVRGLRKLESKDSAGVAVLASYMGAAGAGAEASGVLSERKC